MEQEKVIDLTTDEIQMIQSYCQETLVSETPNTSLVNSILEKITSGQSESKGVYPVTTDSIIEPKQVSQSLRTTSNTPDLTYLETHKTPFHYFINQKINFFQHFLKKLFPS
jgi:hypothetical protein